MNKIEKMIQKFCPNGVEFKTVKDICRIERGKVYSKNYLRDNKGEYPVYSSQTANNGELGRIPTYDYDGEFLTWTTDGAYAGTIFHRKGKFSITNVCGLLDLKDKSILIRFLYYYLSLKAKDYVYEGMGNPKLMSKQVEKIIVPTPPVEVQQEIVRLLDEYTESKDNLLERLKEEVYLRKKQYEYYLNSLYYESFEKLDGLIKEGKLKGYPLSEVGTFVRGKRFVRNDVVESGYPCIHYGDMYGYYGVKAYNTKTYIKEEKAKTLRFAQKGDVVIVGAGENKEDIGVGVAWLGESAPAVHDACYIYKHSEELDPLYISYFLRTQVYHSQIFKHVVEAKICALSSQGIGKAVIPVPSLAEQERIVSILEQYEEASEKLIEKLKQEIIYVQKQYEYYRDKLLTF